MLNKLKDTIREISKLDRPPKEMAKGLALGVLIGVSPYLGFHTILVAGLSAAFRLPIVLVFLGSQITNPFFIPFVYTFTTEVGMHLLHMQNVQQFDWHNVSVKSVLEAGKALLLPYVVGTHVVGLLAAVLTYLISLPLFTRYRRRRAEKMTAKNEAL